MKILKVRKRSVVHNANGTKNLCLVMENRFKKNGYTHVQIGTAVHTTSILFGIVWIDDRIDKW